MLLASAWGSGYEKRKKKQGRNCHNLCGRASYKLFSSAEMSGRCACRLGHNTRLFLLKKVKNGGIVMKVVLIKSPKILCGFLRMIFGIKKEAS